LEENRVPDIHVEVKAKLTKFSDWGALGYCIGNQAQNKIPYITGVKNTSVDELKTFCASVVTFGSKPLFYMKDITPASEKYKTPKEKIIVNDNDIKKAYASINDETEDIDFVCIGCPHASIKEIAQIANLLNGRKISSNTEFWVATSRAAKQLSDKRGYTQIIENAGVKFACDTCMAVAPLKGRFRTVATTSAKGCYYSRHNKMLTKMGSLEECINAGVSGKWS
jgi:predicted aconitase